MTDFNNTLRLIDAAIGAGEDIWELVTDAASVKEGEADVIRWDQCDLAARVTKKYNEDRIGEYAIRANIPKRRAQEYSTMGLFYSDRAARQEFLKENPSVTYSHLRVAMRLSDQLSVYAYNFTPDGELLTVEQCGLRIPKKDGSTSPKTILKRNARLVSATPDGCVTLAINPKDIPALVEHLNRFVNMTLKEVPKVAAPAAPDAGSERGR